MPEMTVFDPFLTSKCTISGAIFSPGQIRAYTGHPGKEDTNPENPGPKRVKNGQKTTIFWWQNTVQMHHFLVAKHGVNAPFSGVKTGSKTTIFWCQNRVKNHHFPGTNEPTSRVLMSPPHGY